MSSNDDDIKGESSEFIDLGEYGKKNLTNHNELITRQLDRLVHQIDLFIESLDDKKERTKQQFRARQIDKAGKILSNLSYPVKNSKEAQKIPGIGKGIGQRIDEVLETGELSELKEYTSTTTSKISELCRVTGIGPAKAKQLIDNFEVGSVNDLIEKWQSGQIKKAKNQLTHHIELGLKYYTDLQHRIPREEIKTIEKRLLKICKKIDPVLQIEICGSYRRGLPTSGDIDVLITHPDLTKDEGNKLLASLVEKLTDKGLLIDHLTDRGKTKYMGFCRVSDLARRIDIRFIEFDSYAPAVLYFTGSKIFNTYFRARANNLGYTLSEYGLYRLVDGQKGDQVECHSERDIFKLVKVKYLSPAERNL